MEFEVLENKKNRLEIKVAGADHTLLNLLVSELQKDKNVKAAAYNIEHPLVSVPKMVIETEGATAPAKALDDAITSLKKTNDAFLQQFEKAF